MDTVASALMRSARARDDRRLWGEESTRSNYLANNRFANVNASIPMAICLERIDPACRQSTGKTRDVCDTAERTSIGPETSKPDDPRQHEISLYDIERAKFESSNDVRFH